MSLQPLDGPSLQTTLSGVNTSVVTEVKVGSDPFDERKVVSMQGDSKFYVYFGDGDTIPSSGDISTDGITVFKNQFVTFEASCQQRIYVLAVTGTVDIKIIERA